MKKRKKEFGYRESFDYIKECKNFIWSIVFIFFIFALIGFFIPAPAEVEEVILDFVKDLLEQTEGMNVTQLTVFIFSNNVQSSFMGFIFGFVLGVFPIFVSILNGYLVGFISSLAVEANGLLTLWRLFPHGIFELPAVFISLGMGLKFGTFVFKKKKWESFKEYFYKSVITFLLIVVPLLIIAAIIEGVLIGYFG